MTVHVPAIAQSSEIEGVEPLSSGGSRVFYDRVIKRGIDLLLVLVCLPIVLPFILLLAAIIYASGISPFYVQERVGRDGRRFRMIKFRTMVPNADKVLEDYLRRNDAARIEWVTKQKLGNDPRCTPLGRALRSTSMDELPQIFNVLIGDMSLVGPRPMMPEQQALYPGQAYYRLRPGMTGSWQVSARNASEFADRAKFDDSYERQMSMMTDLGIIARTFGVVFRRTGC